MAAASGPPPSLIPALLPAPHLTPAPVPHQENPTPVPSAPPNLPGVSPPQKNPTARQGFPFGTQKRCRAEPVQHRRPLPEESSPRSWLGGCAGALAKARVPWGKELSGESPRIPGFYGRQREVNAARNRLIRGRAVAPEAAEGSPGSRPSAQSSAQTWRETPRATRLRFPSSVSSEYQK